MARREKKPVHHVQMTEGKRAIIQQLLQEYEIESAQDIQEALKDLLGEHLKKCWKQRWRNILAMADLNEQTALRRTITGMELSQNRSIVAMEQ